MGGVALNLLGMVMATLGWLRPIEGAIAQDAIDLNAARNQARAASEGLVKDCSWCFAFRWKPRRRITALLLTARPPAKP